MTRNQRHLDPTKSSSFASPSFPRPSSVLSGLVSHEVSMIAEIDLDADRTSRLHIEDAGSARPSEPSPLLPGTSGRTADEHIKLGRIRRLPLRSILAQLTRCVSSCNSGDKKDKKVDKGPSTGSTSHTC